VFYATLYRLRSPEQEAEEGEAVARPA